MRVHSNVLIPALLSGVANNVIIARCLTLYTRRDVVSLRLIEPQDKMWPSPATHQRCVDVPPALAYLHAFHHVSLSSMLRSVL